MIRPVWVRLPVDLDDGERAPALCADESYLVRLADGSVCWAIYIVNHGSRFERVAETSDESTGEVLEPVSVMVSGYSPETIAAALGRASITDRLVAEVIAQIPYAMQRAKQLVEQDARVAS